jgi:hypothetical protein
MLERKWQARMTIRTQSAGTKYSNGKVRRLNNEAFKMVDENAGAIANALYRSTIDGRVMSARLLLDLAEGSVSPEEAAARRQVRSLAIRLANEPEVTSDPQKQTENSQPEAHQAVTA